MSCTQCHMGNKMEYPNLKSGFITLRAQIFLVFQFHPKVICFSSWGKAKVAYKEYVAILLVRQLPLLHVLFYYFPFISPLLIPKNGCLSDLTRGRNFDKYFQSVKYKWLLRFVWRNWNCCSRIIRLGYLAFWSIFIST